MTEPSKPPTPPAQPGCLSDDFAEFYEALDVLFITGNSSGRQKFAHRWPFAATLVLGKELLKYDTEGGVDRTTRAELEEEAETRRLEILSLLEKLEHKSVVSGILQNNHIKHIIERLGRDCALYVYDQALVNRFAPVETTITEPPLPTPVEEEYLINRLEPDPFQNVQPISAELPEIDTKPTPKPQTPLRTIFAQVASSEIHTAVKAQTE